MNLKNYTSGIPVETTSEFSTIRPQHTHSGSEVIVSGAANACPICLAKELTELKRTNERLVELLREGIKTEKFWHKLFWDREVIAEFRHLGLSV